MKRLSFLTLVLLVLLSAILYRLTRNQRKDGMYAEMETSKGEVVFRLFYDKVPMTVANFVALAEGSNQLVTGDRKQSPFYDGLTFHKMIPGVMVQGGDPRGTGNGDPGFRFGREVRPDLKHDRPGIVSMLNRGTFSNGSQFFITLQEARRYDGKHTIFGEVVEGQSVVGRLEEGDTIRSVSIFRKGEDAAAFDLEGRARLAEAEAGRRARETEGRPREPAAWAELPKPTGRTDPATVPADNQPEKEKIALEYLLVAHTGALPPLGNPARDKGEARKRAERLVALAREEGADFAELAGRFSDAPAHRIPLLVRNGTAAETLPPCFRLKPGQVSDPIDTPKGFIVCKGVPLDLIEVRHILISYQGAFQSRQTRSRREARELAETVLQKARSGEDFGELARTYSDSESASEGGRIGEIARGMTAPAFDHAAFALEPGTISNVASTPSGFQIIQRTK
jgi:cyclophilin family peptidyl-prolyl cis-trans isomerase